MNRLKQVMLAATLSAMSTVGSAAPLIRFTDNKPTASFAAGMNATTALVAVPWLQSTTFYNMTISALVGPTAAEPPGVALWWITNSIGPGTSLANVLASGSYTSGPSLGFAFDFNGLARTTVATGLTLGPGDYFLVLSGQDGPSINNSSWHGDQLANMTITLAPGMGIGGFLSTSTGGLFGPASDFTPGPTGQVVMEISGTTTPAVPEPASWAMLITGFGLTGAVARRRRQLQAQPA